MLKYLLAVVAVVGLVAGTSRAADVQGIFALGIGSDKNVSYGAIITSGGLPVSPYIGVGIAEIDSMAGLSSMAGPKYSVINEIGIKFNTPTRQYAVLVGVVRTPVYEARLKRRYEWGGAMSFMFRDIFFGVQIRNLFSDSDELGLDPTVWSLRAGFNFLRQPTRR